MFVYSWYRRALFRTNTNPLKPIEKKLLVYKEYETWGKGYFLSIASGIKVHNFISVFLEI